jgi:hypothetical protein
MSKMIKQNKVAGPTLEYNEIVPTETVRSGNLKDRRRHNDDSKHDEKVRLELAKYARQRAAVEELRHSHKMNPGNYGHDLKSTGTGDRGTTKSLGGYSDTSIKLIHDIPMPTPLSSTPYEHLSPLHLHLEPQKHD